jgi:hypothetical protein
MLGAAGVTLMRARAAAEPLATLSTVSQMHREGRASDGALSKAQYHGEHARRSLENRWTLSGYATQGVLGGMLGLALVLVRRRQGAA